MEPILLTVLRDTAPVAVVLVLAAAVGFALGRLLRGRRPTPDVPDARKKAFAGRAMTREELDKALSHVEGRTER
ncbi:hypothetical protein ACFPTO_20095 [Paraburkholderia denitrificans]|uniref:Uncharacterized protein n=1 Tax=Paraburkholderia denitrificans TaxID=694025 RepID=A0ABW0JEZ2_9BURK